MFGLDASNGNFADGYIAYRSTEPIFGYASVVDNRSSDQIFVLGQEDTGSLAPPPAPTPTEVMVNITPGFVFDPETVTIKRGDTVRWMFNGAAHTTTSDARNGPEVWDSGTRSSGSFAHTFQTAGQHPYYCRIHGGPGGSGMSGLVIVEP
jgi:plastocyanin